jgi:hypothetical protein
MTFYDEIVAAESTTFKYYAKGEWRVSASGSTVPVLNPSKGNIVAYKVQACTQVGATPNPGLPAAQTHPSAEILSYWLDVRYAHPRCPASGINWRVWAAVGGGRGVRGSHARAEGVG